MVRIRGLPWSAPWRVFGIYEVSSMLRQLRQRWRLFRYRTLRFPWRRNPVLRRVIRNVLVFYTMLAAVAGVVVYSTSHPQVVQVASQMGQRAVSWFFTDGLETVPQLLKRIPITDSVARAMLRQSMPLSGLEPEFEELRISEETVREILAAVTNYDLQQPASFLKGQIPMMAVSSFQLTPQRAAQNSPLGRRESSSIPEPAGADERHQRGETEKPAVTVTPTPSDRSENQPVPQPREQPALPRRARFAQVYKSTSPLVGIYHTHTGETYRTEDNVKGKSYAWDNYKPGEGPIPGVVQVGVVIAEELRKRYGIPVVHSTRVHDYPLWSRAYANSQKTALEMVRGYNQLRLLLDIHRDEGQTMTAVTGEQAARVMLVVTTAENVDLSHPHWRENLAIARVLQAKFEELYPGLSRGIQIRRNNRFNQHVHPGALLIEVGGSGDMLEQALLTARLVAHVIAEVIYDELLPGEGERNRPGAEAVPILPSDRVR